jgi:hypothetical protein
MLLLAAETGELLVESWNSINHLPVYTYVETLFLHLLAEKVAYGGSGIKGRQSRRWAHIYENFQVASSDRSCS